MKAEKMTALTAFELLMQCVKARKAYYPTSDTASYGKSAREKNDALDAVIRVLAHELRRILTPADDEGNDE